MNEDYRQKTMILCNLFLVQRHKLLEAFLTNLQFKFEVQTRIVKYKLMRIIYFRLNSTNECGT